VKLYIKKTICYIFGHEFINLISATIFLVFDKKETEADFFLKTGFLVLTL